MADLTEQQASQAVKIAGANSAGVESNYLSIDANGNANVVLPKASTVTVTNVTVTTTSTQVLAANTSRRYVILSASGAAGCFVQFGNSPALVANTGIKIAVGTTLVLDMAIGYTGAIYAIVASSTATLSITEGT